MSEEILEIEEVSEIDTEEQLEQERLEQEQREREEQEQREREEQEQREREEQERLQREREEAEEKAREQARIEHENYLNSFPETTVFYQELREVDNVKWLCGTVKDAHTAESFGWLDNHYDESELTLIGNIYYLKGYEKPESTIEELKAKKLAEISAKAHKYSQYECESMYLVSSVGYKIDADHKSQDNIRGLIGLGVTCRFKDYNNEYHPNTTIEQLQTMLTECYANGAMLYQQKFAYEDLVANAKSREELYFDVVFDMADFSKS